MAIRGKVRIFGERGGGLAVIGELRLPTGRKEDLLGSGETSYTTVVVGSVEPGRIAAHVNAGFTVGGVADEVNYRAALNVAASPRLTIVGELIGRRIAGVGAISVERTPHPTIIGVDTLRLVTTDGHTNTNGVLAGAKLNIFGSWLLTGGVYFPIANQGLRPDWSGLIGLDVTFLTRHSLLTE
jgi:hypothetical protein